MVATSDPTTTEPSPTLTTTHIVKVWDVPTRLFHWTLATSIIVALLSGEGDSVLARWHHPAGWIVVALLAFRLVWGFVGGEHARFANFIKPSHIPTHIRELRERNVESSLGHNPLGGLAVIGLISLAALASGTGILLLNGGGEDLHEFFAYALLALVVAHVLAVIGMSLLSRENLIGAMITGNKSRERHRSAADAKPANPIALGAGLLAVTLVGLIASRVDPAAFTPFARSESGEMEETGEQNEYGEQDSD